MSSGSVVPSAATAATAAAASVAGSCLVHTPTAATTSLCGAPGLGAAPVGALLAIGGGK
ncbi:hypothetical protein ABZ070_03675 [Streptomyces sp. NPDC006283]|uniref:hypothetical protein n=1 Tax=Streptomyces sp. NPDC006283 TaxID=3156741 RepID=UPI0033A5A403